MQRSLFHSLVAILAAGVLILQHAPLVFTGQGEHEHCIHCTGNYCTKVDCDCGHPHRRAQHARSEPGTTSHHHTAPHAATTHTHAADEGHDADESAAPSAPEVVGTYLKTCGAPPSGILTITLDKFVGHLVLNRPTPLSEIPSSARYVGIADQLFVEPFFHPPASRDPRIG